MSDRKKTEAEKAMAAAKKALEARWVTFESAVGKTIAAADNHYEAVYVAYADGTFTAFSVEGDEDDACICDVKHAYQFDEPALHNVGLIPSDLHARWQKERRERADAETEKYERANYERLRARFGAKAPAGNPDAEPAS